MFLDNLPNEILTEIILHLSSFNEINRLREVSRRWLELSDNNPTWRKTFLKDDYPYNQQQSYRTIFQTNPTARKPGYICIDEAGRNYLNSLIDNALQTNQNLTEIQKAHLGSQLVRQLIQTEKLTIDQAIQRSSDEQIRNLNDEQRKGIKIGLTKQQVKTPNFGGHTIDAMQNGFSFETVQGLDYEQIRGLLEHNLTIEQVKTSNFGRHTINAMDNGFSFEEVKNCTTFDDIFALYRDYCPDYYWI
jgi:hypothetical protein